MHPTETDDCRDWQQYQAQVMAQFEAELMRGQCPSCGSWETDEADGQWICIDCGRTWRDEK